MSRTQQLTHSAAVLAAALVLLLASGLAPMAVAQDDAATLDFPEQSSGGHAVVVTTASLPEGGFLAIHDETLLSEEDPFGSVIGVSRFLAPGDHQDVRILLGRPLADDQETLIAMPHKDSNGNQLYDFVTSQGAEDGPYSGGPQSMETFAGNIVVQPRDVQVSAALEVENQRTPGDGLLVGFVDMKEGGFVAIHDSTLVTEEDAIGSVVGVSEFLEPGIHRDVHIAFDRNVTAGPVVPMAHRDTNGNQQYDFVTSEGTEDGPYTGTVDTFAGKLAIVVVEITIDEDADAAMDDQAFGGHAVVVREAYLPESGFVAIHDSTLVTEEDAIGSVIGVSEYLEAGLHRHVVVELDEPFTATTDTFIAMPHKDTNDNEQYDFVTSQGSEDGPFAGGAHATDTFAGNIVIDTATVNLTAAAHARDQLIGDDGRTVTIAFADFSEPGFVAIHDASLLADVGGNVLTSVIGVSERLEPGLHRDVRVTLNESLGATTTIIAMPHKDTNDNGEYDFVTSEGAEDGPFAGGAGPGGISISVAELAARAEATGASPTPASPTTGTPATPTGGNTATPTSGGNTATPTSGGTSEAREDNNTPGFGVIAALAALGIALWVARRRIR